MYLYCGKIYFCAEFKNQVHNFQLTLKRGSQLQVRKALINGNI